MGPGFPGPIAIYNIMNIGISLDGVVANMEDELAVRFKMAGWNHDIASWDKYLILENIKLDHHWVDELIDDSLYWANAIPNDDAWYMINKWFSCGHNIFFVSIRPARQFDISEWWLDKWCIDYNKLFCGAIRGSKNTYIDMLDLNLFIEDDPYESQIISQSIPTLLLNKNYNINYDCDEVVRVDNFYKIDELLNKYF